jgi:hypothetical protein
MPEKIQLFIADPCHEQWGDMQPDAEGRFCGSCQKTVVDFSMMSDQEVLSWFAGAGRSVCGRFTTDQLNRELAPGRVSKKSRWAVWWQLLLTGLLVSSEASAQMGKPTGPGIEHIDPMSPMKLIGGTDPSVGAMRIVIGGARSSRIPEHTDELRVLVMDSISYEPVPWASVLLGKGKVQRMADSLGWISLSYKEARRARHMEVSAVGYATTLFDLSDTGEDEYVRVVRLARAVHELQPATIQGYGTIVCRHMMGAVTTSVRVEERSLLKDTLAFLGLTKPPLAVYPNPVTRGASVTLSLQKPAPGNYMVQLFSGGGALVETMRIEGVEGSRTELLNIPGTVAAGVYFVRLLHEQTGKVYTEKVEVM